MSRLRLLGLYVVALILVGSALHDPALAAKRAGPVSAEQEAADAANNANANDTYRQLTLFSDVFERTRAEYVDPVTDEKLVENAINGMLSSLDPHSGYLNKKSFEDMQTQTRGEFGGLGLEVTMENNLVKVISPIDDTPAAKEGMQPGDLITHLDSKPVMDMTLSDAVDKMRGAPGTKITLTVRRGGIAGKPFDVTLTRAVIRIRSVRWEAKDDIAYIRVTTFNEQTQPGLDKALAEIDKQMGAKVHGYVLDLRNNPGGLLDQAISVAGSFVDAGKEIVSTRSRRKEENQSYAAQGGDRVHGRPIAVLINGGSASASEIVAGALQDYRRAILIGTKSFGKGSVQTIIPVPGGGAMRLTTARYYTPSGRSIQQLGIEPDITVQPAKLEEVTPGKGLREADLRGALVNETVKKDKAKGKKLPGEAADEEDSSDAAKTADAKDGKDGKKDEPFDYQLARALDLLRGVYLFDQRHAKTPVAAPAAEGK